MISPRLASLVGLLALAPGCWHAPKPLYAGAPEKRETEHIYAYSVQEALDATRELLRDLGYHAFPYRDSTTELLTAWRFNGRSVSGSYRTTQEQAYYVQAQALGPRLSVVRIFRIVNNADGNAVAPVAESTADLEGLANLLPGAGRTSPDGQREASAAANNSNLANASVRDANWASGDQNPLERDSRLSGQHRMPSQDDLRGRNDHGVRDGTVERLLVQRLEQFASLEFTGGAYDAPLPAAPAGGPPYTQEWEAEFGGTPFASGGPCGQEVQGAKALARPGTALLVGEQLGTREVPAAVGNLACQLARAGQPVLLSLSIPRDEQGALDAYLASAGSRADQDALLAGAFWRLVPRDGRSSRALVVLLERVRRWKAEGLAIQVLAHDARDLKGDEREEAVASLLQQRLKARPEAMLLAVSGNYHMSMKDGAPWSRNFQPTGSRLAKKGVSVQSLDVAFHRGTRWGCANNSVRGVDCRIYAASPSEASYSPPGTPLSVELFPARSAQGFDGRLHVGRVSTALPALAPREAAVVQPATATEAGAAPRKSYKQRPSKLGGLLLPPLGAPKDAPV
ncbi:MAG TPA: hypothetical protein VFO83_07010, partial [Aggregicoccus sp.]|nr:hypothetical protein [Aggregicoccus sp.]